MSGQKTLMHVDPLRDLGASLLSVEKPARYLGGEVGAIPREGKAGFTLALSFPDLYEIGMSNNAIRILYNYLNQKPGVRCERVFAPAPDFEALLAARQLPLYTLESGLPLSQLDMLGFAVGYELAGTSLLSILKAGQIPVFASDRGSSDPIVIGGGPAISNPHPLGLFLDAAYIGEGESGFCDLVEELARLKAAGAGREDLMQRLLESPYIWTPSRGGKPGHKARRAIYRGFSETDYHTASPIATIKIVQDHGTVEIMRGCPNGCRFCHAGYYYRPQRQKSPELIEREVDHLVNEGGYEEITLASLSSGDYSGMSELLDRLNSRYASRGISFQLPSLRVSSFTLPILGKLAETRKSGLTFAVETPVDEWQRVINKDVSFERTVAILKEAKSKGFRLAKFYFMIGLPLPGRGMGEAEAIVDFFSRLEKEIQLSINVNVGTFVPKPHTPFQWSAQLSEEDAHDALRFAKEGLKRYRNIKMSYHTPFVSLLEGIISRGDDRVGELIYSAFEKGARLDAWDENLKTDVWRGVIADAQASGWDPFSLIAEKAFDAPLPWDDIQTGLPKAYFQREFERGQRGEYTSLCAQNCTHPCGSCNSEGGLVLNSIQAEAPKPAPADLYAPEAAEKMSAPTAHPAEEALERPAAKAERRSCQPPASGRPTQPQSRLLLAFSRDGIARFYPHLSVVEAFNRTFLRLNLPVLYSCGFNPIPRLELSQPLPIGIGSGGEIAMILLTEPLADLPAAIQSINAILPEGIRILRAEGYPLKLQSKLYSLGSLFWGGDYRIIPLAGPETGLDERLDSILRINQVEGASLRHEPPDAPGSGLVLRLPALRTRTKGISAIMEQLRGGGEPFQASYDVVRTACLSIEPPLPGLPSKAADGTEESQTPKPSALVSKIRIASSDEALSHPVSYFEAFARAAEYDRVLP